jgi:hypothetical protein
MLEEDIKNIVDKGDLISAVLGAIVGGVLTYLATLRTEQLKNREVVLRLHCILIAEVQTHLSALEWMIHLVLPAWLHRGNAKVWDRPVDVDYKQLRTAAFDQFLSQLIHSNSLVPIANYYIYVKQLNDMAAFLIAQKKNGTAISEDANKECIAFSYQLLEASVQAFEDLLSKKEIKKYFTPLLINKIDYFKAHKFRCIYLVTLCKYRYKDLQQWERDIKKEGGIEGLPWPFYEDKQRLWRQYLKAADDLNRGTL